jgi:hypothetical protein
VQAPTASPDDATVTADLAPYPAINIDSVRTAGGGWRYFLDGSSSYDPDGTYLAYNRTTNCPVADAVRNLPTFSATSVSYTTCTAHLQVIDANGASRRLGIFVEDTPPDVE